MNRDAGLFEFRFPDIGEGLTEGTVVELKVALGQRVKAGEALAVVETDKVVTDMPSPVDGVVVEMPLVKGQVVRVGEVVARIRTSAAPASAASPGAGAASADGGASDRHASHAESGTVVGKLDTGSGGVLPASSEGVSSSQARADGNGGGTRDGGGNGHRGGVRASPVARKLAADAGIDLSQISGTGPGGRILKKDLGTRSAPRAAPSVAEADGIQVKKLSTLRLAIAAAMEKSQAIPAAAVHDYTLVDDLLRLRREMNESAREKVGLLAFFVKAAAHALQEYPLLSSTYSHDRKEYQAFPTPHIGVAVDTDEGLVVPVVKNSTELSVGRIHAEIIRLTQKARQRTLLLEEIRGGSFTISNFGSFSGVYGNPMILPPQVGILGIGRVHQEPVVKDGAVVAASVLPLSLVVDHRLIDGVYACKFLSRFMELVSRPLLLLMP
ncbi:MAG: dihydrolipoamide acetyltransferase family protein [Spirochaetia bacterium]